MEAFGAIGAASAIVTFLDFGSKLVNGSFEIYHSSQGAMSTNTVLEGVTKDLNDICRDLSSVNLDASETCGSSSNASMQSLLQDCQSLGEDFLKTLEDLKVKGRRSRFKSVEQALQCAWKAKKVKGYTTKLNEYKLAILLRLTKMILSNQEDMPPAGSLLRARLTAGNHLSRANLDESPNDIQLKLQDIHTEQQRLKMDATARISGPHKLVSASITSALKNVLEDIDSSLDDRHISLPEDLDTKLTRLRSKSEEAEKQLTIIKSLDFPKIHDRRDNIVQAHPRTYEWLFDGHPESVVTAEINEQHMDVLKWLRSGSGVYWICGKAGSGKSTFMKFMVHHPKTTTALHQWAGDCELGTAAFYFWSAGSTIQKSQRGLSRSILSDIFKQRPELLPKVCSHRWTLKSMSQSTWTAEEVEICFQNLIHETSKSIKICLFIDGLDEYDGDHQDIITTISTLSSTPHIKICMSSRPWVIFERFYGNNDGQKFSLESLNYEDIKTFAGEKLSEVAHRHNATLGVDYDQLIEEIAERASGVFLWVFLVVRSLSRGLIQLDTTSELRRRLLELPTDLEQFFHDILNRGEKVYQKTASRLYLIQLAGHEFGLRAIDLAHFDESDPYFGTRDHILSQRATSSRQAEACSRFVQTRVIARCQDLLEFDRSGTLQFLHRTVKDFLETKSVKDHLVTNAGESFSSSRFICNSMLLGLRLQAYRWYFTMHRDISEVIDCFWEHFRRELMVTEEVLILLTVFGEPALKLSDDADYHGWLADECIKQSVPQYLVSQVNKLLPLSSEYVFGDFGRALLPPRSAYPLEIALIYMRSPRRPQVIQALLGAGADINKAYDDGSTIWQRYLWTFVYIKQYHGPFGSEELKLIKQLIEKGADARFLMDDRYIAKHLARIQQATGKLAEDLGIQQFKIIRNKVLEISPRLILNYANPYTVSSRQDASGRKRRKLSPCTEPTNIKKCKAHHKPDIDQFADLKSSIDCSAHK